MIWLSIKNQANSVAMAWNFVSNATYCNSLNFFTVKKRHSTKLSVKKFN